MTKRAASKRPKGLSHDEQWDLDEDALEMIEQRWRARQRELCPTCTDEELEHTKAAYTMGAMDFWKEIQRARAREQERLRRQQTGKREGPESARKRTVKKNEKVDAYVEWLRYQGRAFGQKSAAAFLASRDPEWNHGPDRERAAKASTLDRAHRQYRSRLRHP